MHKKFRERRIAVSLERINKLMKELQILAETEIGDYGKRKDKEMFSLRKAFNLTGKGRRSDR